MLKSNNDALETIHAQWQKSKTPEITPESVGAAFETEKIMNNLSNLRVETEHRNEVIEDWEKHKEVDKAFDQIKDHFDGLAEILLDGKKLKQATKRVAPRYDARAVRLPERQWKELSPAQTAKNVTFEQSTRVKVLTYNILAHEYTVKHHSPRYAYDLDLVQDWQYRAERVMMEIENDMPDLLCLQEVDHFEEFYKYRLRALGYKFEMVWRNGKDALLIAYRKEFKLLDKAEV